MNVEIEVDSRVLESWRAMVNTLGIDLSTFVRMCVRTSGPRLVRVYCDVRRERAIRIDLQRVEAVLREEVQP